MTWALSANTQQVSAPFTDCDRLSANPTDARRLPGLQGVQFKELRENLNVALTACSNAVASYPNELRFRYQFARALQIKDKKAAYAIFLQLVAANYPAAYDNVGWLLITENNDYDKAVEIFRAGYALGDADCAVSLFEMIDKNRWQPPNAAQLRLELLEKAAAGNHAGAVIVLPIERAKQALLDFPSSANTVPSSDADASSLKAELGQTKQALEAARRELEALRRHNATPSAPTTGLSTVSPLPSSAPIPSQSGYDERQQQFLLAIEKARRTYTAATNDLLKGAARVQRKNDICAVLKTRSLTGWIGKLTTLSSNSNGKGVISVSIGENVALGTFNNAFSDLSSNTLLEPGSSVYQNAIQLTPGDQVVFSGAFFLDDADCTKEKSLTMRGSIMEPEFLFQFTSIKKK
ncbi:MAG: hypothetical protein NTW47_02670 [Proteobacteria bacterium]|nr:hypothetical protein [Pseudomonadota bacterium]